MSFDQYKKFIRDIEKVRSLYPDYSEEEQQMVKNIK